MAEHDGGYKLLFSHSRTVEELVRGFVHAPWVEQLDFTTLERVVASFVGRDLRQRHSDSIWRLRWRGGEEEGWFYVYLLLEFQSTPDPFMGVRLLGYVALLLEEVIRREQPSLEEGLPAVLPLVLYNGKRPWAAPLELARIFRRVPPSFLRHLPRLRYLLVDESRLSPGDLAQADNLVAALFRLETCAPEELPRETERLTALLPAGSEPELRRSFTVWLRRLLRRTFRGGTIPEAIDLEEAAMLEETLIEWRDQAREEGLHEGLQKGRDEGRQEGRREGRDEGRADGARRLLLQLLEQRFGPLPKTVERRLAGVESLGELERLAARVLTAGSLREVGLPPLGPPAPRGRAKA